MNLILKVVDTQAVTCSHLSKPESVVGRQLVSLDTGILCPASPNGGKRETLLQILCVILALINLSVIARLLYDYYQYKHRGKLPRIVHWLPCY